MKNILQNRDKSLHFDFNKNFNYFNEIYILKFGTKGLLSPLPLNTEMAKRGRVLPLLKVLPHPPIKIQIFNPKGGGM